MKKQTMRQMMMVGMAAFSMLGMAGRVEAATAYLTTDYPNVAVGDTILVSVALDTTEKHPNTVEGTIFVKEGASNIEIRDFSPADSVLTNWLKTPSLEDGSRVSFIGGAPGGFTGKSSLLFKIVFTAKTVGQVVFVPTDMKAYDNDGKATPIVVSSAPLTVTIGLSTGGEKKNQWQDIIAHDNTPPGDFNVTIGRESSVFDGKKFMAISAVDTESGIDYFEVAEGDQLAVRSGMTYVLRDQSESSPITVSAVDKAGNRGSILLNPNAGKKNFKVWIGIAILVLLAGYVAFRRFKSMKKKHA